MDCLTNVYENLKTGKLLIEWLHFLQLILRNRDTYKLWLWYLLWNYLQNRKIGMNLYFQHQEIHSNFGTMVQLEIRYSESSQVDQWERIHLLRSRHRFEPLGRFPWRRKWQPSPVFLPGKSHGQRSLAGYSVWDCKRVRHDSRLSD